MAGQCIVRRGGGRGAGGLADADGNGLTVGQCHDNRRTGDWRADGSSVGNGTALSRRLGRGEFDGGGIDGVGDVGHGRHGARNEVLEVTACCILDRHFDLAGVFVDVIGRRRNGHGAGGFARFDGDHRTVRQRHGYRGAGRVGQRRGVNDRPAFSHRIGRGQIQVGGVGGVRNRGVGGLAVDCQFFVVAASGAVDGHAQRAAAGQWAVRRNEVHRAGGFTDGNGDGLAVGQGHDNR
ncbi:hypothetical protein D3C87_1091460 [compost metagenome]